MAINQNIIGGGLFGSADSDRGVQSQALVGPNLQTLLADGNTVSTDLSSLASGDLYTLTVVADNSINALSPAPSSTVLFFVNGQQTSGITNAGATVSVNPATLGFNVSVLDEVQAFYS